MRTIIAKKYEIVIQPKDDQYCGKCTYKAKELKGSPAFAYNEYKCLLFHRILSTERNNKPSRCVECKLVISNLEKMPELEEGY
jgi:hypothetical protein